MTIMMMERFGGRDGSGPAEAFPTEFPRMEEVKRRVLAPWWMLSLINKSARQSRTCRWLDKKASIRGTTRAIDHTYSSTEMERRRVTRLADVTAGLKLALRGRVQLRQDLVDFENPRETMRKVDELSEDLVRNGLLDLGNEVAATWDREEMEKEAAALVDLPGREWPSFMRESAVLKERLQQIENMGRERYRLDRVVAEGEDLLREVERSSEVQERVPDVRRRVHRQHLRCEEVGLPAGRARLLYPEGDYLGPKGNLEIAGLCDRCMACSEASDEGMLYDLAHMDDRSVSNLVNECQQGANGLQEKARSNARKRLEESRDAMQSKKGELRDLKEGFSYKLLEQLAGGADVDELLAQYLDDEYRKRLEEEVAMLDRTEEAIRAGRRREQPEGIRRQRSDRDRRGRRKDNTQGLQQARQVRPAPHLGKPGRSPPRLKRH